jgi:hypothetical protein
MNKMYSFYPDKTYIRELIRPWKLATFSFAMALLFYGALTYNISDWDVGITIIMGCLTYLMAPWSVYIILSALRYRPKFWYFHIISAVIVGLFVVDWVYMLYHTLMANQTLREANFYASTPLYYMAGAFWLYRGSLKEFLKNLKNIS